MTGGWGIGENYGWMQWRFFDSGRHWCRCIIYVLFIGFSSCISGGFVLLGKCAWVCVVWGGRRRAASAVSLVRGLPSALGWTWVLCYTSGGCGVGVSNGKVVSRYVVLFFCDFIPVASSSFPNSWYSAYVRGSYSKYVTRCIVSHLSPISAPGYALHS